MTKTKHINSYDWLIEDFQEFYNYKNCQSYYSEKFCSTGPLYSEDGNVLKDNHEFIWRLKLLPRHIDSYISLYIWPIQNEKNLEKLDCYGYLSEKKFIFNSDRPCQGVPEFCKISQIFPDKDYKKKTNLLIRIQFTYPSFNQINANTSEDEESNKQLAIIENPICFDLEEYINNEKFSDVTFEFGCGNQLKASKIILSIRSDYFKKMFNGEWSESNSNVIKMDENISSECFKEILYFLYTNRIQDNLSFNVLKDIYSEADMRDLEELKDLTAKKFIKMIDKNNWSEILLLGWNTNNSDLNNTALKYINKNWSSVRDSEQMKSILSCVDVDLTESLFCARFFGKFL
ncbi:7016_t:CDS:2 [Entrophospora sp. SA101]|nr:7016_t:CDS:2 [Entrophospora sp. SA101]